VFRGLIPRTNREEKHAQAGCSHWLSTKPKSRQFGRVSLLLSSGKKLLSTVTATWQFQPPVRMILHPKTSAT